MPAAVAAGHATREARTVAAELGAPAFVVGVALAAAGAGLPRIARSIASPVHATE